MSNAEIPWALSVAVAWAPAAVLVVLWSALLALFGWLFERRMSYPQHWLTCLIALAIVSVVALPYFGVSATAGLSRTWDGLATLLFVTLAGLLITRFARWKYGIARTGWFGLGTKVILSFVVPFSVLAGAGLLMSVLLVRQYVVAH